jgi:predicted secreted protein
MVNPVLIAVGQEETEESQETSEEVSEEISVSEDETSSEETMTEEEVTDEELADDTMMIEEEMMMTTEVKSPKKQMADGVEASAVVCNEGLQLIIKTSTGSAACVKSSSVDTLIARGWGSTPA